jgi:CBS domain-containing protein
VFTDHDYLRYRSEAGPTEDEVPVSRFMTTPAITVRPRDPAVVASALLLSHKIGCLPVIDDRHHLVGLLTAGDILAADLRASVPPARPGLAIGEVMTPDPVTARPYQPVLEAVALMTERGFKHVPIVDDEGRLIGIISDRDVRTAIGDPAEALGRELTEIEEMPISTVMTAPAESVDVEAPLIEVAHRLAHESIGALPVVDDHQRVVGIVSYVDVVRSLLDLVTSRRPPQSPEGAPAPSSSVEPLRAGAASSSAGLLDQREAEARGANPDNEEEAAEDALAPVGRGEGRREALAANPDVAAEAAEEELDPEGRAARRAEALGANPDNAAEAAESERRRR